MLKKMLANPNLSEQWQEKRQIMLNDKIDVTSFWAWLIENYPISISEIENNVNFWNRFK